MLGAIRRSDLSSNTLIAEGVLSLLAVMCALAGCHRAPSADAAYEEIVKESRRGEIGQALQHADLEYRRYVSDRKSVV